MGLGMRKPDSLAPNLEARVKLAFSEKPGDVSGSSRWRRAGGGYRAAAGRGPGYGRREGCGSNSRHGQMLPVRLSEEAAAGHDEHCPRRLRSAARLPPAGGRFWRTRASPRPRPCPAPRGRTGRHAFALVSGTPAPCRRRPIPRRAGAGDAHSMGAVPWRFAFSSRLRSIRRSRRGSPRTATGSPLELGVLVTRSTLPRRARAGPPFGRYPALDRSRRLASSISPIAVELPMSCSSRLAHRVGARP